MKTKFIIGIITFALFSFVLPVQNGWAQDTVQVTKREAKKIERKKRKEEKKKKDMEQRLKYAKMLREKHFVFKANRLIGPRGESFLVTPSINFLAVNDSIAVFQFGFEGVVGWNGVGGFTYEGYLQNYRFNPGKRRNSALSADSRVRSTFGGGTAYFNVSVMDNGSATLNITMPSGVTLRMTGDVVSLKDANIYKGQTVY